MTKSDLCFFLGGEWPGVTHTQLCGYTPWFLGPNLDTQGAPANNKAILGISNIRIIFIHPHPMVGYFDPKLRKTIWGWAQHRQSSKMDGFGMFQTRKITGALWLDPKPSEH